PAQANGKPQTTGSQQTTSSTFNILNTEVFGFSNIFPGDNYGDDLVGGFKIEVGKTDTNQVLFNIKNNNTANSFISQINFDDKKSSLSFNSFATSYNVGNVGFESNTKNLSQSNNIDNWVSSFGFKATSPGANKAGVDQGESLGILFDGKFEDVIASFKSGDVRVGMHVQGIGNGYSDAFYTKPSSIPSESTQPQEVPEPGTLFGLLTLGGMVFGKKVVNRNS
ncbi:PEP-CTERM sorting domain-containing protein, partial [Lyngbya sp. PCC 8106]|uniref:PEP-CTERM sorting domain-containing protein n=1 Tax=Lyngbya sp. (strain PCC 8106) TaxID=313612 RepID=UPI0000EAD677